MLYRPIRNGYLHKVYAFSEEHSVCHNSVNYVRICAIFLPVIPLSGGYLLPENHLIISKHYLATEDNVLKNAPLWRGDFILPCQKLTLMGRSRPYLVHQLWTGQRLVLPNFVQIHWETSTQSNNKLTQSFLSTRYVICKLGRPLGYIQAQHVLDVKKNQKYFNYTGT